MFQRLGHLTVEHRSLAFENAVVRCLARQLVFEDVLQLGDACPFADQFLALQIQQHCIQIDILFHNGFQNTVSKNAPDDRRQLQDVTCIGLQTINAGRDNALQRVGDRNFCQIASREPAVVSFIADDGLQVDQGANDFLNEEGVAFGAAENAPAQRLGQGIPVQQVTDQTLAVGGRQRMEPEVGVTMAVIAAGDLAHGPRAVVGVRTKDENQQQRGVIDQREQVLQQFQ